MKKLLLVIFIIASVALTVNACSPSALERGVVVGKGLLKVDTLFSQPKLGRVTAIEILENDSLPTQILVVGRKGASFINEKGKELNYVQFEYGDRLRGLGNVQPVFKADRIMYLNRGGGWQPVSLHDHNGKKMWEFSKKPHDVALIDLDADGEGELIVGNRDGLFAFENTGEQIWREDVGNVTCVRVFKENGVPYIIHNDQGSFIIRSVDGKLIRKLDVPFANAYKFEIDEYKGEQAIFSARKQKLYVCDFNGKKLAVYSMERTGTDRRYVASQLMSDQKSGSIISNSLKATSHTSEWYLYNQKDSIVYHEIYEGQYPVINEYSSGSEIRLLVGCANGTVKVYTKSSN